MARTSYAEQQIPQRGADATPYPDHREVANKILRHGADMFVGEVAGAGGVGGVLSGIPFEPAIVDVYEPVAPVMQRQVPGSGGAVDVNLITGAAASTALVVAVDDASAPSWKVTLAVGHVANGRTATVVCTGFRDAGGSL